MGTLPTIFLNCSIFFPSPEKFSSPDIGLRLYSRMFSPFIFKRKRKISKKRQSPSKFVSPKKKANFIYLLVGLNVDLAINRTTFEKSTKNPEYWPDVYTIVNTDNETDCWIFVWSKIPKRFFNSVHKSGNAHKVFFILQFGYSS